MINLTLMTDTEILKQIASRAKDIRIKNNLRQSDLSERSAVPLSSIRVFERSGKISLVHLIKLMRALSCIEELDSLFLPSEIEDLKTTLKESKTTRKRVRK